MERDLSENGHGRRRDKSEDEDSWKVERKKYEDRKTYGDREDRRERRRRTERRESDDDGEGRRERRRMESGNRDGSDDKKDDWRGDEHGDGGGRMERRGKDGNKENDDERDDRKDRRRKNYDDDDDKRESRKVETQVDERGDRRERRRRIERGESDDDGEDKDRDDRRTRRRRAERGNRDSSDNEKDDLRRKRDGGEMMDVKQKDENKDDNDRRDRRRKHEQVNDDDKRESRKEETQVDDDDEDERDDRRKKRRRHEGEGGDLKDDRKEKSRRNEGESDGRKERRRREDDDEKVHKRRKDEHGHRDRVDRYNDGREGDKRGRKDVEREKRVDGDDNNRKDIRQRDGDDKHGKEKNRKDNAQEDGTFKANEDSKVQKQDANLPTDLAKLGRSGGVYIPPFKLARMMKDVQDKSSVEYQRMTWDALRKSINGLVNKVNAANLKNIIPELFAENLIRGRGLFCRSCMKSQMASPGFTDVFAALVAVVNTKFPEVGDLLLRRIILQLQRAYKRNDKPQLLAAVKFIAHLVNQQIVHELIALELLTVLLEKPTDDSVEVAVGFVTECGSMLQDLCPRGLHGIFERFRGILHEGEIDKRVQFLIESLFALRKAKFQGYQAVRPELDLVEQEDQLTHEVSLSDTIDPEIALDIFKPDPNFLENERKYEELKKAILGEESEEEGDSDAESEDEDEDEESDEEEDEEQMKIKDETETNLINLRRTIYLTIMSSVDFEEAGHKLLKIKLEPGQEMELCIMLLECCSQERTYLRYYGLLGQRFCMINKIHQENFEKCFVQQYSMIHRLETNKLRNVAKFFAHLLGTDALPWHCLAYIRLTEEDTTSSSRIFIKILFQEMSEHLGIRLLNERLNDPTMQESLESIFPKDNPKNTRFAINFFTSIGLGGITESLREYLKNMPRLIMQQQKPVSDSEESGSSSGSESSESESESSSSSSEESDDSRRKQRKRRR
ncbi:pre-mRNA-splicing factor CWC22 homolog [Solanum pennellii]|uniref:Pre-mRNA-splicing factor CWC22 homolog n=1 Tax=Solanum pennellii TaxID=28526 RepID=A0ABM1GP70_SOLPN|nr:pre-mRNA-splicing factor CWC22 homolog [Solanum pennellii]